MNKQFNDRTNCGLCGNSSFHRVRKIENFPILKCSDCGFIQTGKLLNKENVKEYYEDGYGGLRMRQGQEVNAKVNFQLIKKTLQLKPEHKLLDVGCGYGFLIKSLQDRLGIHATGVELASSELEYARNKLKLDVRASLDEINNAEYDVVCLFEVIEHIAEPLDFIHKLITYLKPGGKLILATDNFNSAVVKSMENLFPKWIPHQHISLFDENSLPLLVEKTGKLNLEVIRSFTPWELVVRSQILKISSGKRGGREFRLEDELKTEADRPYPLFKLRKSLNSQWAKFTLQKDLTGEMMYIVAHKY